MAPTRRVFRRTSDGALVLLRPITARDRRGIERGFQKLSPQSRYRRFLQPLQRLSAVEVDRLLDLDQRDRVAWGVIELGRCEGVALGRYARLIHPSDTAEVAITVLDAWQGRGVGRLLLRQLVAAARANGIDRLVAEILAENEPALSLFRQFGARCRPGDRGLVLATMELRTEAGA